jgi:serine/threonine-protein kinase
VDAVGPGAILGDYTLGARVERRSHADVYEATHAPTGAPRLVYVLRPDAVQDHPFVHQVICEVDAARWLRHPAIAKVDGYGDAPGGGLYVAADLPPGRPLGVVLAEGGRMSPRRVVRMAHRLVEAIEEAHAVGLVHGRLSPTAILVAGEADARQAPLMTLTGFGTGAVALDGDVGADEQPYVSPERLAGRELDVRADVFGLASVLHHALAGEPPADGAADLAPAGAGSIADSIADVIAAARAADPKHRPATVKAFWEDLLAALVGDVAEVSRETPLFVPTVPGMPVVPLVAAAPLMPLQPRAVPPLAEIALISPSAPRPWPLPEPQPSPAAQVDGLVPLPLGAADAMAPMRPSGSVDVWASAPVPAFGAPSGFAGSAAPLAMPVPAPLRLEDEPPPPAVQFRDTWERQRPSRPVQMPAATPTVPAPRRRRTALAMLWWLAVPAAAAAAGWPLAHDGVDERAGRVSNSTAAFSVIPGQEMPRTAADTLLPKLDGVDTTLWADDTTPSAPSASRDAGGSTERDGDSGDGGRIPAVAPVTIPTVALPGAGLPDRPGTVRPAEFGVAPPGAR